MSTVSEYEIYRLHMIIETCRPYHDDLVRGLAESLLEAYDTIVSLETKASEAADRALEYAQTSSAINLSWILNLDKINKKLAQNESEPPQED